MSNPNAAISVFRNRTEAGSTLHVRLFGNTSDDRVFPGAFFESVQEPVAPEVLGGIAERAMAAAAELRFDGDGNTIGGKLAKEAEQELLRQLGAGTMSEVVRNTAHVRVSQWPGPEYDIESSKAYDDGRTADFDFSQPQGAAPVLQTLEQPTTVQLGQGILDGLDRSTTNFA